MTFNLDIGMIVHLDLDQVRRPR